MSVAFTGASVEVGRGDYARFESFGAKTFTVSQLTALTDLAKEIARTQAGAHQVMFQLKTEYVTKPRYFCRTKEERVLQVTCQFKVVKNPNYWYDGPQIEKDKIPSSLIEVVTRCTSQGSPLKMLFE